MNRNKSVFALIVGSGFSGSLLAWILQTQGKEVVLIDRSVHPRFAIGESTTPTADFLLKHIADRWGLNELAPLASYGAWQRAYPEIVCGKKRGFAYYAHVSGKHHCDDDLHSRSMMVAASIDDEHSDTHWLRSSVDEWLFRRAVQSGVASKEETMIQSAQYEKTSRRWHIVLRPSLDTSDSNGKSSKATETAACESVDCQWLIDASGGSIELQRWTGNSVDSGWMRTKTGAVFGHFESVLPFASQTKSYQTDVTLFDGDDSAQHHVMEDGWMWALRFGNGTTSLGFVLDQHAFLPTMDRKACQSLWNERLARFPSLAQMMRVSNIVAPDDGLRFAKRLSRCNRSAIGDGWLSLPTAFGFVDPLHSTGIAHALSGVHRIATALLSDHRSSERLLEEYARDVRQEIEWLDTIVALTYRGLPSFERFTALACFYFVSAIGFERDVAKDPEYWPRGYMLSRDTRLRAAAELAYQRTEAHAADVSDQHSFVELVREWLEPWNDVGLLSPLSRNRITHSAASKF